MVSLFRRRSAAAMKDKTLPLVAGGRGIRGAEIPLGSHGRALVVLVAFIVGVAVGASLPPGARWWDEREPQGTSDLVFLPLAAFKSNKTASSAIRTDSNSASSYDNRTRTGKDTARLPGTASLWNKDDQSSGILLRNQIFFGNLIEESMPPGFTDAEVEVWRDFARRESVVRLQEGCGRMQNRLLVFSNGTQACCRYRQNFDQIQGEIFSFYLSRLLGLKNIPPSILNVVKSRASQWAGIGSQLALAQWGEDRPIVVSKFIDNLDVATIPEQLRTSFRRLHPFDIEKMNSSNVEDLVTLAQWSDLIIFDYLTGNLDRVVNNLYNLQWNPAMMDAPAHNLARKKDTGLLVFLDNESGLLHGYRLLDKYEGFHASLLDSLCVFRASTANRVRSLATKRDVGPKLRKMFKTADPGIQDYLPTIPDKSIKTLNERLKRVYKQIKKCQNLYFDN